MKGFEPTAKQAETTVQRQTEIGSKDDPQEKEADAVAEKVMRMGNDAAPAHPDENRDSRVMRMGTGEEERLPMGENSGPRIMKMGTGEEERLKMGDESPRVMKMGDDEEPLRKKEAPEEKIMLEGEANGEGGTATPAFTAKLNASKGKGTPLPENVQQDLGGKMDADLSDVNVHTGSDAHEMAAGIHAKAFTHGQNIYFRNGNYNPSSAEGKKLLAHEAAHTVQQGRGVQRKVRRNWLTDALSVATAPLTGGVSLLNGLYRFNKATPAERNRVVQANLLREINDLKSASEPSTLFKIAYYGAMPLVTAMNPLGMRFMPSMQTMWQLWVKAKLGYYLHLYNLSKNPAKIKKKNESTGKEEMVDNPDYAANGYAEVIEHQMQNMINPMYAVGGMKGVVMGIVGWVVDIVKMVGWLCESAWSSLVAMKDWMLFHKPPGWVQTLMDSGIAAGLWLKKNGATVKHFIGAVIAPKTPDEQDISKKFKESLLEGAGEMAMAAGDKAASMQVSYMNKSAFEQGEMMGKIVGYIIPDILLAVFSDTIANWIKWLVEGFQKLYWFIRSGALLEKVLEGGRWALEILTKFWEKVKVVAKGVFGEMGAKFEEIIASMKKWLGVAEKEDSVWAKISGIVRDATKGKGNFGLGKATYQEAMEAGKAWMKDGYSVASDGKTLVSQDGLRQFRPPSFKPKLGKIQANFEWRNITKGKWQGNGHLDII